MKMLRPLFLLAAAAGLVVATPMTYTISGTGSGSWNSQPFTNANFTFIFTSDTSTIVHGTACCSSAYTTPPGIQANVGVAGFAPAYLVGDQAIFMNPGESTAGIWHYNSPDYITIGNPAFASADLTTNMGCCVTGTTFAYVTPIPLSTGGSLYFSSVSNVTYAQQAASSGNQISAVSVTPSSGTQQEFTIQTYSVVVSDTAGAADIGGVDVQFRDKPTQPNACWLYYNAADNTLAVNKQGVWSTPAPLGSGGSALTGDACVVNTTSVTVALSGNNLTLSLPIQFTFADNNTWPIFVDAQTKANVDAGYTQLGTVTVQSPQGSGTFTISASPDASHPVYARPGDTLTFTVTLTDQNGFNEPVTFSASATAGTGASGNTTQLGFSFNPPTLTTSGTTILTVTTPPDATPDVYAITVTGTSQTLTERTDGNTSGQVIIQNGPPIVSISPNTGSGTSQKFTVNWQDSGGNFPNSVNLLFAPSLDGRNACWIYYDNGNDANAGTIWLASDDGASWTSAGSVIGSGSFGTASNSQCTIGPFITIAPLSIPITFKAAFAGTKTIFIDAANGAGFDTGYQPRGGWTVP